LLTGQRAGAQPRADGGFLAADSGFRQAAATVAGGFLPGHATAISYELDVPVALTRWRITLMPGTAVERGGMVTVGGCSGCRLAIA
jgi:hypothetical protein